MENKNGTVKKRVEMYISNVSVTDKEASCIVTLSAVELDAFRITTIELTGLLFAVMEAGRTSFESFDSLNIPEPKIKKVSPNAKHYRKWTPEEIERAKETRRQTMLQQNLTRGNAENKPVDKPPIPPVKRTPPKKK